MSLIPYRASHRIMFENTLFLITVVKSHLSLIIGLFFILFVVDFCTQVEVVQLPVLLSSFGLYSENTGHFSYYPEKNIIKSFKKINRQFTAN